MIPRKKKKSFGHCPNWGGPAKIDFENFFKMKKNAQIACRGKGNLDNAQKKGFFSGKFSFKLLVRLCISMATSWKISLQFTWHVMKTFKFCKHVFKKVENILVFFQSIS